MSKIFIGLKKTCLGVLDRGERVKDNKTGLKKGREIEMSTTVLPLRDARSLHLNTYHPTFGVCCVFCLLRFVCSCVQHIFNGTDNR